MKKLTVIFLLLSMSLFAKIGDVDFHGYVSQGYMATSDYNYIEGSKKGTAQLNEIGFNLRTKISETVSAGIQISSRDYADYDNNKVEIDWAYGTYAPTKYSQFDAGILKVPVGMDNETRDIDALRTFIFLPVALYDEEIRDLMTKMYGISLRGSATFEGFGTIRYKASIGDPMLDLYGRSAETVRSYGYDVKKMSKTDFSHAAKLEYVTPLEDYDLGSLEIGGTYYRFTTRLDAGAGESKYPIGFYYNNNIPEPVPVYDYSSAVITYDNYIVTALFGKYTFKDLSIFGEYVNYDNNDVVYVYNWNDPNKPNTSQKTVKDYPSYSTIHGYYGGATYRVTDWLEVGGYYSDYIMDRLNGQKTEGPIYRSGTVIGDWGDYKKYLTETSLTIRFDLGYGLNAKIEGKMLEGLRANTSGSAMDPKAYEAKNKMIATKITYSF